MTHQREPIFYASMRAFFVTIFKMVALVVGLVPLVMMIGMITSYEQEDPDLDYWPTVIANADNTRKAFSGHKPTILQIDIHGMIGTPILNNAHVRQMLLESREGDLKGDKVKAVFLHINTGGGGAVDSDGIYHALKEYKEMYNVPIYAYVDGLCASGGMYVAASADKIFASHASAIGSVGVLLSSFMNVHDTLEKIGVKSLTLYAGAGKDNMNPLNPFKPEEAKNFEELTKAYYEIFVDIVAKNRPNIDREKLVNVYGAQVFPANLAKEYGYVDEVGKSRNEALQELVKAAGLDGAPYQVITMKKQSFIHELIYGETPLQSGLIKHRFDFGPESEIDPMQKILYLYRP